MTRYYQSPDWVADQADKARDRETEEHYTSLYGDDNGVCSFCHGDTEIWYDRSGNEDHVVYCPQCDNADERDEK